MSNYYTKYFGELPYNEALDDYSRFIDGVEGEICLGVSYVPKQYWEKLIFILDNYYKINKIIKAAIIENYTKDESIIKYFSEYFESISDIGEDEIICITENLENSNINISFDDKKNELNIGFGYFMPEKLFFLATKEKFGADGALWVTIDEKFNVIEYLENIPFYR
jgi:hypothetical protein